MPHLATRKLLKLCSSPSASSPCKAPNCLVNSPTIAVGCWKAFTEARAPSPPCRHHFDEDLAKKRRLAAAVRDACLGLTGSYAWRRLLKVRHWPGRQGRVASICSGICIAGVV